MSAAKAETPAPFSRAMVLAAGLGTRMRPLTNDRPKPLVEVAGKPLIDYTLDRLAAAGVAEAVVNVHYFADMMEAHLTGRARPRIIVSDERAELLDTGGGFRQARPLLGEAAAFYANTDAVLLDGPHDSLQRMKAMWRDGAMDALLLLAPLEAASGYDGAGDFYLGVGDRLERRGRRERAPFVWTGVQILHPRVLDAAPASGAFSTNLLWDAAIASGRAYGVLHDGGWMHVGSPDGLKEAERRLDRFKRKCA